MNLRAAGRPRGDFEPLPPRSALPRTGFVVPRSYDGPDVLRKGQVVKLRLAGGEVTPGLSQEMLRNAALAAAGNQPHSLFEYAGSHYGGPLDAWIALRVVQNPIPLLWIVGSIAATLGAAWTVREMTIDEAPAGSPAAATPGAFDGISVGSSGIGVGGVAAIGLAVLAILLVRS